MHNLQKIKLFRILLFCSYPIAVILLYIPVIIRRKNPGRLFFMFDRYSAGGAQTVHLDILDSVKDQYKMIFFTRSSPNNSMKDAFFTLPNSESEDIHQVCDNLLLRLFAVHYYAFYINRHKGAHLLSSNSTFFYDMLPFLSKNVIKTELLHAFTYGKNGMEFFGLGNFPFLDHRIVVDRYTRQNIEEQYDAYKVPLIYKNRVQVIEPGVLLPDYLEKKIQTPLKILYVGRSGPPKRIYLMSRLAEICHNKGLEVEFHFAGDVANELSETAKEFSVLYGHVSDKKKLASIYSECHIIMILSYFEGFPMTVKEGMAYGCVPLVTGLGGLRTHLEHLKNALIIDEIENEDIVVHQALENIELALQPELIKTLSEQASTYARDHFSLDKFRAEYRKLLLNTDSKRI